MEFSAEVDTPLDDASCSMTCGVDTTNAGSTGPPRTERVPQGEEVPIPTLPSPLTPLITNAGVELPWFATTNEYVSVACSTANLPQGEVVATPTLPSSSMLTSAAPALLWNWVVGVPPPPRSKIVSPLKVSTDVSAEFAELRQRTFCPLSSRTPPPETTSFCVGGAEPIPTLPPLVIIKFVAVEEPTTNDGLVPIPSGLIEKSAHGVELAMAT